MSRYIDADKLTEAFVKAAKQVGNIGDQIAFRMMIDDIPTADVRENVRGKWKIEYTGDGWNDYIDVTCTNCGKTIKHGKPFNFCPNCGAEMERW